MCLMFLQARQFLLSSSTTQLVVVEGFHKLTPGMKVRVSDPEAEAGDSITTTKNEVTGVKENTTGTKDNAKGE